MYLLNNAVSVKNKDQQKSDSSGLSQALFARLAAALLGLLVLLNVSLAQAVSLVGFNINLGLGPIFNPAPAGELTPPAFLTFAETATDATMSIVGGDFDTDSSITFGFIGDFWSGTFNISQDSGFVNDVLSINGTFQHIVSPPGHNDNPFGGIFNWNFVLDADDATGTPLQVSDSKQGQLGHNPFGHADVFDAALTATVTSTLGFDDITGWTFVLSAAHTDKVSPVPVPAALWLFVSGLVALFGFRHKSNDDGIAGACRLAS